MANYVITIPNDKIIQMRLDADTYSASEDRMR